jgi:hypothetical protein
MTTLVIRINTDNAAFEDDRDGEFEKIFRFINHFYNDLEPGEIATLHDSNGNAVGTVEGIA